MLRESIHPAAQPLEAGYDRPDAPAAKDAFTELQCSCRLVRVSAAAWISRTRNGRPASRNRGWRGVRRQCRRRGYKDFAAVTAARLTAVANNSEIVVDAETYGGVARVYPDARRQRLVLKGKQETVEAYWIPP